jgi:hypothetical protein
MRSPQRQEQYGGEMQAALRTAGPDVGEALKERTANAADWKKPALGTMEASIEGADEVYKLVVGSWVRNLKAQAALPTPQEFALRVGELSSGRSLGREHTNQIAALLAGAPSAEPSRYATETAYAMNALDNARMERKNVEHINTYGSIAAAYAEAQKTLQGMIDAGVSPDNEAYKRVQFGMLAPLANLAGQVGESMMFGSAVLRNNLQSSIMGRGQMTQREAYRNLGVFQRMLGDGLDAMQRITSGAAAARSSLMSALGKGELVEAHGATGNPTEMLTQILRKSGMEMVAPLAGIVASGDWKNGVKKAVQDGTLAPDEAFGFLQGIQDFYLDQAQSGQIPWSVATPAITAARAAMLSMGDRWLNAMQGIISGTSQLGLEAAIGRDVAALTVPRSIEDVLKARVIGNAMKNAVDALLTAQSSIGGGPARAAQILGSVQAMNSLLEAHQPEHRYLHDPDGTSPDDWNKAIESWKRGLR